MMVVHVAAVVPKHATICMMIESMMILPDDNDDNDKKDECDAPIIIR